MLCKLYSLCNRRHTAFSMLQGVCCDERESQGEPVDCWSCTGRQRDGRRVELTWQLHGINEAFHHSASLFGVRTASMG